MAGTPREGIKRARLMEALVRPRQAERVTSHCSIRDVVLKRTDGEFYFVSRAGALCIGDSHPLADEAKRHPLAEVEGTTTASTQAGRATACASGHDSPVTP